MSNSKANDPEEDKWAWLVSTVVAPDRACLECGGPNLRSMGAKYCSERCCRRVHNRRSAAKQVESGRNRERKAKERLALASTKPAPHHPLAKPEMIGHKVFKSEAKSKKIHALKQVGWSKEAYNQAYIDQGGKCYLCGSLPGDKLLAADHNHATGKPRRLLCGLCNRYLGVIENNNLLDRIKTYLEELPVYDM